MNLAPTVKVWMGEEKPQNFKGAVRLKLIFCRSCLSMPREILTRHFFIERRKEDA
ncbi:hypothetical protein D931_01200 [Enterococcus faecium 13.SD.W.09]|nr:hypothetical protein D931_01200 [Enterococcus faecium 13.SD.W.09]